MRVLSRFRKIIHARALATSLAVILPGAAVAQTPSSGTAKNSPPEKSAIQDKKETKASDSATTKLRIVVTANDKPVSNASVYVKYNEPGGLFHHDKLAEMSFRSNEDGSVKVPEIPRGKILIQVIAKGWRTYGKWYEIETETQTIQIKLERPPHWY